MSSPWITALRSVALEVPDLPRAEDFYTRVWQLRVAARTSDTLYLRGSGSDHHLLSLRCGGAEARIRHVTLRAPSLAALEHIAAAAVDAGASPEAPLGVVDEPSGGVGVTLRDPEGRCIQVVHGDHRHASAPTSMDVPVRLAHVVLNSPDVAQTTAFFERAFGFKLSDRTRIMAFLNCNADHHSIALGDADNVALNHIAFSMPDLESVMRGAGRLRDAGHAIEWGPGRHGPGNNVFSYFVDPFDIVIEYTAEVAQIDQSYRPGGPDDWRWPEGRIDQWGISPPPSPRLKRAQRSIVFAPAVPGSPKAHVS